MKKDLEMTVNGKPYKLAVEPGAVLVTVLRDQLKLTGTKIGCLKGKCGACTVLLDGKAVPSCLVLALQANGKNFVTIEGLEDGDRLHPIQESFIINHGIACGYCAPGMILVAKALLNENSNPTEEEVRQAVHGHICRCGTYPKIVKSVLAAATQMRGE